MNIIIYSHNQTQPEKYPFSQTQVLVGRNPSSKISVTINEKSVSRDHLKIRVNLQNKIQIMDLNSSNGTFLTNNQRIQSHKWVQIEQNQHIQLADHQGYLSITLRKISQEKKHSTQNKKVNNQKKIKENQSRSSSSSSSSSSSQRERSRDKADLPFKISDSTLKMLKQMTVAKKPKQQRVKFLKLMGIGRAEQYWQSIQKLLKKKRGIRNNQQTSDQLQKQFNSGRSTFEKKGLGK